MKKKLLAMALLLLPVVASASEIETVIDNLQYVINTDEKTAVVKKCDIDASGDIVVPASVTYEGVDYGVTGIGESAFQNCENLTSITLPNSVTSIGKLAFRACVNATSINIPDNVKVIEDYAFDDCKSLKSIIIPDGVTTIGEGAFGFLLDVTSLTIPNSVTVIGKNAFSFCGITSIVIPDNVTEIKFGTFSACTGLQSVTLGKGVKELHKECFSLCFGLADVYILTEDMPVTDSDAFSDCDLSVATLHVPEGSLAKYQKTEPWNQFGSIVTLTDEETAIKSTDRDGASEMLRFTLDGHRISSPQKGVNIIRTRDGQTRKVVVK